MLDAGSFQVFIKVHWRTRRFFGEGRDGIVPRPPGLLFQPLVDGGARQRSGRLIRTLGQRPQLTVHLLWQRHMQVFHDIYNATILWQGDTRGRLPGVTGSFLYHGDVTEIARRLHGEDLGVVLRETSVILRASVVKALYR